MKEQSPIKEAFPLYNAIVVKGQITPETAETFSQLLEAKALKHDKIIPIVVSSNGGDTQELFLMLQDMDRVRNTYHCKIRTIAKGYANSAATLLVASGDKGERWAYPDSEFLIHGVSITVEETETVSWKELKKETLEARQIQRKIYKALALKTGHTLQEIYQNERPFTSEQAKDFGIIDKIMRI